MLHVLDSLISIQKANQEFGKLSNTVVDFITTNLSIKSTVSELELSNDGQLKGGIVDGRDCLTPQDSMKEELPYVHVGPDSVPTLSFTSGSEGRPKAIQGRQFSLTYYFPWMANKFGISEDDRFSMPLRNCPRPDSSKSSTTSCLFFG
jgi:L-aminoadipate-semialdehyde dehydrogenase